MTYLESLKTPISFFSPLKLMPVLPPTEASTIASRVVGMLMKLMPRLKVEAAKPPRSVTMPPPRLMRQEWRDAPPSPSDFHTWAMVSKSLWVSVAPMVIICAFFSEKKFLTTGRHSFSVVSSTRMNILSCSHSLSALAISLSRWVDMIIL